MADAAPGAAQRQKLLDGGFQPSEVQDWENGQRSMLTQAGFSQGDIDEYFGVKAPDNTALDNATKATVDPLYAPGAKPAINLWDNFMAGIQMGASNLPFKRPNIIEPENAGLAEKIVNGLGQGISDLPVGLFGGAGGAAAGVETGPGALATAGAGFMALPSLVRSTVVDAYRNGSYKSPQDVLARISSVLWETTKSAVEGALGGPAAGLAGETAGKVAGPVAETVVNPLAFTVASTTSAAALEHKLPAPDDFAAAAVLALGFSVAAHGYAQTMGGAKPQLTEAGEQVQRNLEDIYVKTGLTPEEALAAAAKDPAMKAEVLATRDDTGEVSTPLLQQEAVSKYGRVDPVEPPQPVLEQPKPAEGAEPPEPKAPFMKPEDVPEVHLELFRALEGSADDAVSPAGAIGRYQIMPDTARQYGFDPSRLQDPAYNELVARHILADLNNKFDGNVADMAVAYNAGPGTARAWIRGGRDFSTLPRETQKYLLHAEQLGALGPEQTFTAEDLTRQASEQGVPALVEPPFEGNGGGKEPPLSGEILPPEEGPKKIEGLVPEPPTQQDHYDTLADAIAPEAKQTLGQRLGAIWQMRRILDTELAPARRIDEAVGSDRAEPTIEDNFRQGLYGSASRHLSFFADGIVRAVKNAKGDLEYILTGKNSRRDAYKAVKEDGGNQTDFMLYWLAAHAVENAQRGIKSISDDQLAAARATLSNDAERDKYERGLQIIQTNKNGVLDYAEANDLYSPDRVDNMKTLNPTHLNLRRAMDPKYSPSNLPRRSRPSDPLKKQTGSERPILDPVTNDLDNQRSIITMADRNHAWLNTVDRLDAWNKAHPEASVGLEKDVEASNRIVKDLKTGAYLNAELIGEDGKVIPDEVQRDGGAEPFLMMRAEAGRLSPDHIIIFRKGVPEVWKATDPATRELLHIAGSGRTDEVVSVLTKLADLQRTGIVSNLFFGLHVATYGTLQASVVAEGGGIRNIGAILVGAADMLTGGKALKSLRANGGDMEAVNDIDNRYLKRDIDQVFTKSKTWTNVANYANPLTWPRLLSSGLKRAAEVGFYKQSSAGRPKAAMLSRSANLDHAERFQSEWVNKFARTIPFFKPTVQDFQQVQRALVPHAKDFKSIPDALRMRAIGTVGKALVVLTAPALALAVANAAIEKAQGVSDKDSVNNMPAWMRDLYWNVRGPGGVVYHWPAPPSPITFLFKVLPERAVRLVTTGNKDSFNDLWGTVGSQIIPPSIPPAVLPVLETVTNHNFFTGRPVVPESVQGVHGWMQYGPATSETAKALARLVGPMSPHPIDVSPYMVDNWAKDWTGTLPMAILRATEGVFNPNKPATDAGDLPFLGSFFTRNWGAGQALDDFYTAYDAYIADLASKHLAIKRGDSYEMTQTAGAQKLYQVNQYHKAITAATAGIRAVEGNKDLSPDEKRKLIDQFASQQYAMSLRALSVLKP